LSDKEQKQFEAGVKLGKMYSMPFWTAAGIWWGMYVGMVEKTYGKVKLWQ